ncbi:hypothetical protein AU509_00480 [Lonsdalea britannica]|uniref:Uncharacterized protein n=1 Tax=Lonsdalea britannica TaxID=1082704 RepID=A0AAD0SJR3_9GAMM|nr:hypothetical protein [Lonsdalea britannica]AXW88524.1 hypothetical protein CKQ53_17100 [Lonsdalea britannica]OSN00540.1 hypothetical protein AU509_00480 [Lonsdalea britannica]OSN05895.1 hypothetical protein AU510_08630 [Lonsdalea britannica]
MSIFSTPFAGTRFSPYRLRGACGSQCELAAPITSLAMGFQSNKAKMGGRVMPSASVLSAMVHGHRRYQL